VVVSKGANSCKLVCKDVATGSRNVGSAVVPKIKILILCADVVELVDTLVLGAGAVRCGGSSPLIRTKELKF
jgi:hypothetical protein